MCLATDACLTADPGVVSLISAQSHTLVENDHEIISTVILLPSTESFKKGCCQLQTKVCTHYSCLSEPIKFKHPEVKMSPNWSKHLHLFKMS